MFPAALQSQRRAATGIARPRLVRKLVCGVVTEHARRFEVCVTLALAPTSRVTCSPAITRRATGACSRCVVGNASAARIYECVSDVPTEQKSWDNRKCDKLYYVNCIRYGGGPRRRLFDSPLHDRRRLNLRFNRHPATYTRSQRPLLPLCVDLRGIPTQSTSAASGPIPCRSPGCPGYGSSGAMRPRYRGSHEPRGIPYPQ